MKMKRVCKAFAAIVTLTVLLAFSAFAFSAQGGTVTAKGSLNMRSQASTSSSVLARLPGGTKVLVLEDKGSWYKIAYNGMIGYVSDEYISLSSTMDIKAGYAKVTSDNSLRLRSGPGTDYAVLAKLSEGTTAEILGVTKGWIKVKYQTYTGYLSAEYISVVSTGNNTTGNTGNSGGTISGTKLEVTSSGNLRMRSGPGIGYDIITKLRPGTIVNSLGESGDWYKVQYGNYTGYISAEYAAPVSDNNSDQPDEPASDTLDGIQVTSSGRLNMRKGPGTSYTSITKLPSGAVAKLVSKEGSWYKVTYNGYTGYVSADYCKLVNYASASAEDNTPAYNSVRDKVVAYAKKFLGTKYTWGGNTPSTGFDCSGFVKYVLAEYGYSIPRTSATQYNALTHISKSNLKPGDLIFFGDSGKVNHVGMYIGNNNFIHAENSKTGVCISSLSSSYYTAHYIGCGRVITD